MKRLPFALCSIALLMLAPSLTEAAEISFSGYTNGCFGSACTPTNTADPQDATLFELEFNNTTFSDTSVGGNLALDLGTFDLTPLGNDDYAGGTFKLRVTFQVPTGISGGPTSVYTSVLTGTTSSAPGQCNPGPHPCGFVKIDFDNTPTPFTFSNANFTGSFSFNVNDLTIDAGQTGVNLTGNITLAQQQPTTSVTPAPEPASLILLGTGLLALARHARRRS